MALACGGCAANALWGVRSDRSREEETRAPACTLEVEARGSSQALGMAAPYPLSLTPASPCVPGVPSSYSQNEGWG